MLNNLLPYIAIAAIVWFIVISALYWGYLFYVDGTVPPQLARWQGQADVIHGRMFGSRYTSALLPTTPSLSVRFDMPPPVDASAPFGFPLTPVVNTPERLAQIDAILAGWPNNDSAANVTERDALRAERDALRAERDALLLVITNLVANNQALEARLAEKVTGRMV